MTFPSPARRQRGAAALLVTTLLFLTLLLVVAAMQRQVLIEVKASTDQQRSTQAFEAAEAGLEWVVARLNDDTLLGDDCLPSSAAGAASFRDRHLPFDPAQGRRSPATWNDAGADRLLQATCVRGDAGWSCGCPASGPPTPADSEAPAPAFAVVLGAGSRPDVFTAIASGCLHGRILCADTAEATHEAAARIEVAVGRVTGLAHPPAAALSTRGDVDAGAASLGLRNGDAASSGLAVDAGGRIIGSALRIATAAGSSLDVAVVSADATLGHLDEDRFFARWFGMGREAWLAQPAVTRIACAGNCSQTVVEAIARGARLIGVDGDLALAGPLEIGSIARPVIIAVSGELRLSGAVRITGFAYAGSLEWRGDPGGQVRGAAASAAGYIGDADADFVHDGAVLDTLRAATGSLVRVDGSWKDF